MNEGGTSEKEAQIWCEFVWKEIWEGGKVIQNELSNLVCKCNITGNVTELTFANFANWIWFGNKHSISSKSFFSRTKLESTVKHTNTFKGSIVQSKNTLSLLA